MATPDAIRAVYFAETDGVAHTLIHQLGGVPPAPIETQLYRLGGAGYSVGLEIGVAIGITDIAAARRLQQWLAVEVQRSDPDALAARDRMVANFLRVLDR